MKIDSSKNRQPEKKESKNVYKTSRSVYQTRPDAAKSSGPGVFEQILEENRRDMRRPAALAKRESVHDAPASASETSDNSDPLEKKVEPKHERESGTNSGDQSSGNDDGSPNSGFGGTSSQVRKSPNSPPARAILHVADLERVIAMIRTDNFRARREITIDLRNSVLKGLEIKLTLEENGRVKAEFRSASATVREKLRERRRELASVLNGRSPLFSEILIGE